MITRTSNPRFPPNLILSPAGHVRRCCSSRMKTTSEAGLPPVPGGRALLTKKQLAQELGKSERTIDNWRARLGLPFLKIEHSVMFRLSDVIRHLEKNHRRSVKSKRRLPQKPRNNSER